MLSREEKFSLFTSLVATVATVELKGDTIPYCSLNGHMYCYLSKEGLMALRLPGDLRQQFIERYQTTLMTAYGIVQKEYVVVPDHVLQDIEELKPWFRDSHLHVGLLKPKPTKAKKKD